MTNWRKGLIVSLALRNSIHTMSPSPEFYLLHTPAIGPHGIDEKLAHPDFLAWREAQSDDPPIVSFARLRSKGGTDLYGWITSTGDYVGSGTLILPMGLDGTALRYPGLSWVFEVNRKATGWYYTAEDMFWAIGLKVDSYGNCETGTSETEVGGVSFGLAFKVGLESNVVLKFPAKQSPDVWRAWLALSAMGIAKDIENSFPPEDMHMTSVPSEVIMNPKPPPGVLYG